MKNVIVLHGSSCSPDSYWIPWIKNFLEMEGYDVWAPQLPHHEAPDLAIQLPFILNDAHFNAETILIGHSSGCPLILSMLERIDIRIDKALLVAGYARTLRHMSDPVFKKSETDAEPILQTEYNWGKIKENVREIFFINSDNDPWGCDDTEGRYMFDHLGGMQIIRHGEGHMGSDAFDQPYKEFPLLQALIRL